MVPSETLLESDQQRNSTDQTHTENFIHPHRAHPTEQHQNLRNQSSSNHGQVNQRRFNTNLLTPSTPWSYLSARFKRCVVTFSPVKRLENKASVARDHLANERTFLAWFRTSLSLTSIGIALAQLSRIPKQIRVIPVTQLINAMQPILHQLNSSTENQQDCNASNTCISAVQEGSIKSILNQINQNLMNLESSLNQFNDLHSIDKTKNLASLIAKFYVCLGLVFLVIDLALRSNRSQTKC